MEIYFYHGKLLIVSCLQAAENLKALHFKQSESNCVINEIHSEITTLN